MDSMTYDISDKENATPSTKSPPPTWWSPRHRPMYSPGGAHISKPPRRPAASLRSILADSPSRRSYQHQMTKHWASTPKCHRTRSASPRRTPEPEAGGTTHQQSYASVIPHSRSRFARQSSDKRRNMTSPAGVGCGADKNASPPTTSPSSSDSATSGCKGGVPIHSPLPATRAAKPLRAKNSIQIGYSNPDSVQRSTRIAVPETRADASSTSSTPGGGAALPASETHDHDPLTPMNDLEAAVARCFDDHSPTASREERRKTLHIVNGGVQIPSSQLRRGPRQQQHQQQPSPEHRLLYHTPRAAPSSSPSSSSSAAWTGDDVFLPPRLTAEAKMTSPCRSSRVEEHQKRLGNPPRAAVKQQQHFPAPLRCLVGSTCSRSPLSLPMPTRQRADSALQIVETKAKSRFGGVAVKQDAVRGLPKRPASDADDEDEASDGDSSGTSSTPSSC